MERLSLSLPEDLRQADSYHALAMLLLSCFITLVMARVPVDGVEGIELRDVVHTVVDPSQDFREIRLAFPNIVDPVEPSTHIQRPVELHGLSHLTPHSFRRILPSPPAMQTHLRSPQ